MLSFIRAVFRQPHGGVIYTESGGASGKRRRKETAPSTILTKQFKRLSCLSFLLVHVWKESSSMAANEAEERGMEIRYECANIHFADDERWIFLFYIPFFRDYN